MAFCENCGKEISDQAYACPVCGHPGPAQRGAIVAGVAAVPYAGWWQRVAAAIIDGIVVAIPSFILMTILSIGMAASDDVAIDPATGELVGGDGFMAGFFMSWLLLLGLTILYRVLMEGSERGQTLGKMALRIRVQDVNGGGSIGYGRAFVRWLVASILWIALYIPGIIDVLFPLWDPKKQTLHDKAASSVVVQL